MRALSTWIDGFIGSAKSTGNMIINTLGKKIPEMYEYFVSGFGGYGWKISEENEKFVLEIDSIRIREALVAKELVIDKIRAIAGSLGISQACGKVKSVDTESDTQYILIKMEGDETHGYGGFVTNDFIRCQTWNGSKINGYWVKVSSVDGSVLKVDKSEFRHRGINVDNGNSYDYVSAVSSNMDYPTAGDEIVQYGNSTDTTRQSAIYIHANSLGKPALDILEGINTKSFANCLTLRLGGELPNGGGFGLYTKHGHIVSKNGNDVNYEISPDGNFTIGNGAISYDPNTKIVTIGSNVVIKWGLDNQSKVMYSVSTDGKNPPSEPWYDSMDYFSSNLQGKYVWTRTRYPDGSYSYSVSYMGKDGQQGVDGTNGQNMRQNLMDYTEFIPEIFEKKPDGITLNGTRKEGLDGCGALYAKCATAKDDIWMFQENVKSRLVPSEWYTLSFYAKTDISESSSIAVYLRSDNSNLFIEDNKMVKIDGKDVDFTDGVTTFALTKEYVRHTITFKTNTSFGNFYILFRLFNAIKDAYITQVKLERSSVASDWCRSETDKVAAVNLPEWLGTWNGQTTSANAQYVAARNAFFGVRDTNDKYTGIMMSSDGLQLNGESQAIGGLYALSNNEVKVVIDPIKSIYRFQGKILCDGGQMEGLHVGTSINGITSINENNFDSYFTTKDNVYIPDFYAINPVLIMTYMKNTGTAADSIGGLMFPPYSTREEDYNLSLGFLGKTFFIINKTGAKIRIKCPNMSASNYAMKLNGQTKATTNFFDIENDFSASITAHLNDDSRVFWVVEKPSNKYEGNLDVNTPILPPSGNKWYFDKYTNNIGGGNITA